LNKTLPQWFSYIENLHCQTIALGLERVGVVAQKLGALVFECPVITVAGTNGKGSSVAFLEAIFTAAGYTVGAYTSPHLLRFNERIRIANQMVSDAALVQAFEKVEQCRGEIALTYFEFTTLAALCLFQAVKLDVLVLEVGLGGRLDAVNLIAPDVAVITSIALDHMDWLGETREAIGYEKAGIFRADKPAVCGDPDPPETVLNTAKRLAAPLYCIETDFNFKVTSSTAWTWRHQEVCYDNLPMPSLPVQNAATVLMVVYCLRERLQVSETSIAQGLKIASLPGRFQIFPGSADGSSAMRASGPRSRHPQGEKENLIPQTILDVAHNPAAAHYLAKRLKALPQVKKTYAVVSILSDKDIIETLRPLLGIVSVWYVATLELPRGSTAEKMANCLQTLGVAAYDIRLAESVIAAYKQALNEAHPEDRILVFGSFHTVGPVLECLHSVSWGE